jgi:F0F1-type ATP synthase assembly protein I
MRIAALATEAVLSPAIGAWIGFEADRRFGCSPWGMLGGLLAGGGVSLRFFWVLGREEKDEGE